MTAFYFFPPLVAFIALFVAFGWASIPLAYLVSSIFRKPSTAFSIFCLISVITGIGIGVIATFFETLAEDKATEYEKALFYTFLWFSRMSPVVSLILGTQKLFTLDATRLICAQFQQSLRAILCGLYAASSRSNPELEEIKVLKPERCCDGNNTSLLCLVSLISVVKRCLWLHEKGDKKCRKTPYGWMPSLFTTYTTFACIKNARLV